MCRNIKPLFNFDPPVTDEEIRAASLQFVRKISGFHPPSRPNEAPFQAAVEEITGIATNLLKSLKNVGAAAKTRTRMWSRSSGPPSGLRRTTSIRSQDRT